MCYDSFAICLSVLSLSLICLGLCLQLANGKLIQVKLNGIKLIAYEETTVWFRLDWWVFKSLTFLTTTTFIMAFQFTRSDLKLSPLLLTRRVLRVFFSSCFYSCLVAMFRLYSSFTGQRWLILHVLHTSSIGATVICTEHGGVFFAQSNFYSCVDFFFSPILTNKGASASQMCVLTHVLLWSDLCFRNRLYLWVKSCCFSECLCLMFMKGCNWFPPLLWNSPIFSLNRCFWFF